MRVILAAQEACTRPDAWPEAVEWSVLFLAVCFFGWLFCKYILPRM